MAVRQHLPVRSLRRNRQINPRSCRGISAKQVVQNVPFKEIKPDTAVFARMLFSNINRRLSSILITLALLCAYSNSSHGADKIRLSVTNFNMSFLPAGLAVRK